MHLLSCGMFLLADIHISVQQGRPSLSAVQEGSRRAANNRMFSTVLTPEVFIQLCLFLFRSYLGILLYTELCPLCLTLLSYTWLDSNVGGMYCNFFNITLAYLSLRGYFVCVLCWDSLVDVIHCWYYHMLIKIITHIYPDLPVCQYVCCADPPKKLFTFYECRPVVC